MYIQTIKTNIGLIISMVYYDAILLQNLLASQNVLVQGVGRKVWGRKVWGCKVWGAKCGGAKCGGAKYGAQSVGAQSVGAQSG